MLLIGSRALIHRGGDTGRKPLDIDVIATFDELGVLTNELRKNCAVKSIPLSVNKTVLRCADSRIIEVELAWPGSTGAALLNASKPHIDTAFKLERIGGLSVDTYVSTFDQLYTLKMSHRYLKNSPHFLKTRNDIMYMRNNGAKIWDSTWLKQREDETYDYGHPKLDVMKKDFFRGDGVEYIYEHDDIHIAMSHFAGKWGDPVPAYTLYAKDGEEVKSDKAKFFAADEELRLYGVIEEVQVLALERSQIPHRGKATPRQSFDMALMKVCTSITSGWFREYAWENYDTVSGMYEPDYVSRFWEAVEDGIVRKIDTTDVENSISNS